MVAGTWSKWRWWTLGAGLVMGCGGSEGLEPEPTFPVAGRVVLASGQPLTGGRVAFVPKDGLGVPAAGEIGPDGRFTLTTRAPGDGAAAREYKVRIEPPPPASPRQTKPKFPLKYVDEDSSGVVVTVRAEANQLDPIRLK